MLKDTQILGVKITTSSEEEILEFIGKELDKPKNKRSKVIIFTPNPEQISAAQKDPSLKQLLNKGIINLPDGWGVVWASNLLGKHIKARLTGVDFMEKLLRTHAEQTVKSGYFGGKAGVAEQAANCLQKKMPKMAIGYASDVYNKEKMIHSDIDILFVGLGFPKQEKWIIEHMEEIPATIIMSVGGSFDFIAKRIPRAPKLIRNLGLEWAFRLILQPQRFFRQLRIWHFGALILVEALSSRLKKSN